MLISLDYNVLTTKFTKIIQLRGIEYAMSGVRAS